MDMVNDLLERQSGDGVEKHLGKSLPLGGVAPGLRNLDIIIIGHETMVQVRTLGKACGESTQDQHLELDRRRSWRNSEESGIGAKSVSRSRELSTVPEAAESQER